MSDKKKSKKVNSLLHSILKGEVKPEQPRYSEPCEICSIRAYAISSTEPENKSITVTYKCERGHEFFKEVNLK